MITSIETLKDLKGKTVLLRADFNVPIKKNSILDPFRIIATIPTIFFLKKAGAKVVIVSHSGDDGAQSLKPMAVLLGDKMRAPVGFVPQTTGPLVVEAIRAMKNGGVLVLENIRREKGEKENSTELAKKLASYADIYVNDAFPVSHRPHASIVGVPKYLPHYAGFQMLKEIEAISPVLQDQEHPFVAIFGGAKFETKLPLIKKFQKTADAIFIGGALFNQCLLESGFEVGKSLVEQKSFGLKSLLKKPNILLPMDVRVISGKKQLVKTIDTVAKEDTIVDIGDTSVAQLAEKVKKAKLVLWNGPLGKYETGNGGATLLLAQAIKKSPARVVVGGGDSAAAIASLGIKKKNIFISTGGGATLEFLAKGTLPGIKALEK